MTYEPKPDFRIDHVSLAVNEHEKALAFFKSIFGGIAGQSATADGMKYRWQLLSIGDLSRLEIISPTEAGSFLDTFLKNKSGAVHHISLQTSCLNAVIERLEHNNIPYFGYQDYGKVWKELFIHPQDAFGLLIQIAQFDPHDWLSDAVTIPGRKKWEIWNDADGGVLGFAHPGGGKIRLQLTRDEIADLISDLQKQL